MSDCARQHRIVCENVNRQLADPRAKGRIMPLRNALADLHGSFIRIRVMGKDDPQKNIKFRELAGNMRHVVQVLNRSPTGIPAILSNAYSAICLIERQPEMAMIYVRELCDVANDYLVFENEPISEDIPASSEILIHSSPPGPSLAAN